MCETDPLWGPLTEYSAEHGFVMELDTGPWLFTIPWQCHLCSTEAASDFGAFLIYSRTWDARFTGTSGTSNTIIIGASGSNLTLRLPTGRPGDWSTESSGFELVFEPANKSVRIRANRSDAYAFEPYSSIGACPVPNQRMARPTTPLALRHKSSHGKLTIQIETSSLHHGG